MNPWKIVKLEVGVKFWRARENTGPIGKLPNGDPRLAPRMTVIDETCRTMLLANLVALASFSLFPAIFVIGVFDKPEMLRSPSFLFSAFLVGICSLALLNGLVTAIRLDTLMPVVGSPLVKGIHFDWGKPKKEEPESALADDEADGADEQEDERVGAFKDMLSDGRRA